MCVPVFQWWEEGQKKGKNKYVYIFIGHTKYQVWDISLSFRDAFVLLYKSSKMLETFFFFPFIAS